jgi:endoglucanase
MRIISVQLKVLAGTLLLVTSIFSTWSYAAGDKPDATDPVMLHYFNSPLGFDYEAWKQKLKVVDEHLALHELPSNGGGGITFERDLSAYTDKVPVMEIKVLPKNKAVSLGIMLLDKNHKQARWSLPFPAPSDKFVSVIPTVNPTLGDPAAVHGKEGDTTPFDYAHIVQMQISGDWSGEIVDIELGAFYLADPKLFESDAGRKELDKKLAAVMVGYKEEAKVLRKQQEQFNSYGYHVTDQSPKIVHVSLAAPEILAVTVEAQKIIQPTVTPYEAKPGDKITPEMWPDDDKHGARRAVLERDGKRLGVLQGPKLNFLTTDEMPEGDPFLEFTADDKSNYTITSHDDPLYMSGVKPTEVYRKTMPTDSQLPGGEHPTRHRMYLKMATPFKANCTYTLKTQKLNVHNPEHDFRTDFANLRSDSIHVNQNGYRPDDPYKRATLSLWMGTGGAWDFGNDLKFSLVEDVSKKVVYTGKVEEVMGVQGTEQLWTQPAKNYAKTAVYKMDFGDFKGDGNYRVVVDGIGSSYPFNIDSKVWERAFLLQMKGLYNNRSGIEVGPPYSDFKKPRDFHPDDGATITRSTYDVVYKGMYNLEGVPKEDTGEVVKNAWGGYHDAGDWNPRRVTHMLTTFAQLELVEILPEYFNKLNLNIPKTSGKDIPDVITEALWEVDCFRRMQQADGAIPYGIESQTDPMNGELSWLSTQHLYVLAPNMRDSWLYAAVAGRVAKVLRPIKPELAKEYETSAIKAFNWGEQDYAKRKADGSLSKFQELWMAVDARNIAALVLYDITDDKKYHGVFMEETCLKDPDRDICSWGDHIQTDAAFLYARMDDKRVDPTIKKNARAAILRLADQSMEYAADNAFNITSREKGRPMFAGFFSVSGGMEVARAHYLTGKVEYLKGAVQSCQFQTGCNPNNLVYTTGMGSNPVKNPLHLDSRASGQAVPVGLTVFGNADIWNFRNSFWDINLQFTNKPEYTWPNAYDWPLPEAYFDVWLLVSTNEFVIDTWQQNVFVWGYLAARK